MNPVDIYHDLAQKGDIRKLLSLAMIDERVFDVVVKHDLVPRVIEELPSPEAARFLSKGVVYDPINIHTMNNFVRICSLLSQYEGSGEGTQLAELVGNCGYPEQFRKPLFNFSETYRHLILSKSYYCQRAVLRLLSYMFCDDFNSDAVAQLQQKSDILNHVNNIFVATPDFVSWRFSVRVMSLGGGYNEDRFDVDSTEKMTRAVTKAIPEFFTYFSACFVYSMFRQYPRRVRGVIPKWLCRHRAYFSSTVCGLLGVYSNSYADYQQHLFRIKYEARKSAEVRRRAGARRRGIQYERNTFFDDIEGATRRVYDLQWKNYATVCGVLFVSLLPLTKLEFPKYLGDVQWRYPHIPRFFPAMVGMPAASRCLIPFLLAPYTLVSLGNIGTCGTSLYDRYIEQRWQFYKWRHNS